MWNCQLRWCVLWSSATTPGLTCDSTSTGGHVAVILNVTPNHLDRYASLQEYAAAKARVMRNMRECDTVIYKEECADFIAAEVETCPARKVRFTGGKPLNGFEFGLRNGKF